MGVWYTLVNFTKRQIISLSGVSGMKAGELISSPAACTLTVAFMLTNVGDDIAFVPDDDGPPVRGKHSGDLEDFEDVTERYLDQLIDDGDLVDKGRDSMGFRVIETRRR